ncbi:MAG: hypothetical protein RL660_2606 [Bacteroidota bacterium]|jgi:sRNA-binding regulator protein Hfq
MKKTTNIFLLLAFVFCCSFGYKASSISSHEKPVYSSTEASLTQDRKRTSKHNLTRVDASLDESNALVRKPDSDEERANVYNTIGVLLSIIGFGVFLFASILIGLVMIVIGIILLLSGASANKAAKAKRQQASKDNLQDVIYFKNGSEIRGTIIEQVMNDYVKIQTADKSILVFKHDEILRIAKEAKPKS